MPDSAYGDVQSVAAHLAVSQRTVRRFMKRGLRYYKLGRGQQCAVRIKWTDLEAWLEQHTVER